MPGKNGKKWKERFIFDVYEYAKEGMAEESISKAIGVHYQTIRSWIKTRPVFALALQSGRAIHKDGKSGTQTFVDYVYKQLPPDKKKIWDEVLEVEKEKDGKRKAYALMNRHGLRVRQYLFIHAWVCSNFNITAAMRKIGVSRGVYNYWIDNDPVFQEMAADIRFYQKEFFKSHLFILARCGDTAAVMYGNRVYNRDEGFDERANINVNIDNRTQVVEQTIINVAELHLSLEVERELLAAIEHKEKQDALTKSVD